jgi:branched-chain amino acid transport system permease protein
MLVAPKGLWGVFSARTGIHLFPTRRRLEAVAPSLTTEA